MSVLDAFNNLPRAIPDIRVKLPYSGQEILMRPFNTKEQMSIAKAIEKRDFDLIHKSLDSVLTNCVLNEGFNIKNLIAKERDILLIRLRAESISEEFNFDWVCNGTIETEQQGVKDIKKCGKKNTENIDLDELPLLEISGKMDTSITLCDRDCVLNIGISTRGDEIEAMEYADKIRKSLVDDTLSDKEYSNIIYASTIKSIVIEGKVYDNNSFEDKLGIIEGLHSDDRSKFDTFANQVKGLEYDFTRKVKCKSCKHEQNETMQWLSFFLM